MAWPPSRPHLARDLLLLSVVALLVRLVGLDHTPHYDEFFHVLAAREWLAGRTMCIADCLEPYDRASAFTYLVAASYNVLGQSLWAARIPAVIAGTLWVAALFLGCDRAAGRTAAWTAGLMLALDPGAIYLSQIARFYALHALAFLVFAGATYVALEARRRGDRRAAGVAAGVALAAFLLARHLQITTLIGASGVAIWVAVAFGPAIARRLHASAGWRVAAVVAVVFGAALVLLAWKQGLAAELWRQYRWSSLWTAEAADTPAAFHRFFLGQYGWLWTLFPGAALLALTRRPRAAAFCLVVFLTGFLLHSGSGYKAFRVIYYLVPFFFAIWGMAFEALGSAARATLDRLAAGVGRGAAGAAAVAALLFTAYTTPFLNTTVKLFTAGDANWPSGRPEYRGYPDWVPAVSTLRPIADSVDVVVASAALKSIYYLGRVDVQLNAASLYRGYGDLMGPEFVVDWRGGFRDISRAESVEALVRCYPSGLIVVERHHWGNRSGVPDSAAAEIERAARRIELPDAAGVMGFRWDRPAGTVVARCSPPPLEQASVQTP